MTLPIFQTPTENLDWQINWATRGLGADIITASVWAVVGNADNVTLSAETFTNTTTTMWLTGGIAGTIYKITNTITLASGRIMQETLTFSCGPLREI